MSNKEKTVRVTAVGEKTGETFSGDFTFKTLLSHDDAMRQGRIYRELLGPNATFATDRNITMCDSHADLVVRIVKAPPAWRGVQMEDDDVVTAVHKAALEAEEEAGKERKAKADEARAALAASLTK